MLTQYIAIVTLEHNENFYLLVPRELDKKAAYKGWDTSLVHDNSANLELIVVSYVGCIDKIESPCCPGFQEKEISHFHFQSPMHLFRHCLPEDLNSRSTSPGQHYFLNYEEILFDDNGLSDYLKDFHGKLLSKRIKSRKASLFFNRISAKDWLPKIHTNDADKQYDAGAIINPNLPGDLQLPLKRTLDARQAVTMSTPAHRSPSKREITTPNGGVYRIVFNIGPLQIVVRKNPSEKNPNINKIKKILFPTEEIASFGGNKENNKLKRQKIRDLISDFEQPQPLVIRQSAAITKQSIAASQIEKKLNGCRLQRQDSFFGLSAKKAIATHFPELQIKGVAYEYTHLIAYGHIGEKQAQNKNNLVLATKHCNSMMMFLESIITYLAQNDHDITVEVTEIIDTSSEKAREFHSAERIVYCLTVDNNSMTFEFDPRQIISPPKGLYRYFWSCIEALLDKENQLSTCKTQLEEMKRDDSLALAIGSP